MRCVILGAGSVGAQIAQSLSAEDAEITLIESNQETIRNLSTKLDCLILRGWIPTISLLKESGIEQADFFIACTNSDEVNIISCGIVAAAFEKPKRIARIRNQDYNSDEMNVGSVFNIDYIVVPEVEASDLIMRSIAYGALSEVYEFFKTDVQIRDFLVSNASFVCNKEIREIAQLEGEKFLIAAVQRDNEVYVPRGNYLVREGDLLFVATHRSDFDSLIQRFGQEKKRIQRVTIAGGGKIGQRVASMLLGQETVAGLRWNRRRKGVAVRIVDNDIERCKTLAGMFPRATVINADISEENVFVEEELDTSDLFISLTDNQEINLVVSQYAKALGIPRTMALVIKNNYAKIANRLGIDVSVNRKAAVVNSILRYIRGSDQKGFQSMFDGKIEVWELEAKEKAEAIGQKIRNIDSWQGGVLIIAIRRLGVEEVLLPDGDETIEAGDVLAIVAEKNAIGDVRRFFEGKQE